jgi:hypothetical protein
VRDFGSHMTFFFLSGLHPFVCLSRAVVEYRISKRVKEQFEAFMSGFSELIPQDLINVFDERELEVRQSSPSFLRLPTNHHHLCATSCLSEECLRLMCTCT